MELDDQARRILSLARDARTPSAEDKARIERGVALALGATVAVGTAASIAPAAVASAQAAKSAAVLKTASTTTLMKSLLGGGTLLIIGTASYALLSSAAPSAPAPKPSRPVVASVAVPEAAREVAREVAPEVPAVAATPREEKAPEAMAPEHARRPSERRTLAARTHEPPAASRDDIELLHQAQAAWRGHDADRALSLLADHRKLYPRSQMQLERDALQVLTLCELGRQADAAALAQRFLKRAPRSPLRSSIEQSCALK